MNCHLNLQLLAALWSFIVRFSLWFSCSAQNFTVLIHSHCCHSLISSHSKPTVHYPLSADGHSQRLAAEQQVLTSNRLCIQYSNRSWQEQLYAQRFGGCYLSTTPVCKRNYHLQCRKIFHLDFLFFAWLVAFWLLYNYNFLPCKDCYSMHDTKPSA